MILVASPMPVRVYSNGFVRCSICAPRTMSREDVEAAVNAQNPSGVGPWRVSDDEAFSGGEPNPYDAPGCGRHWLMEC